MQYITRLISNLQQQVNSLIHRIQQLELIVNARNRPPTPQSPKIMLGIPPRPRQVFITERELNNIHET